MRRSGFSRTPLPRLRLRRRAGDRRAALRLRDRDVDALLGRHAVLDRGDLGEDRDRDLRRRAAADVEADRAVQARDLVLASRRTRAAARAAWRCWRASRARRRRTPATCSASISARSSSFGSCVSATTAQRSSSRIACTVSSGIVRTSVTPGNVPRLGVLLARVADRHLVVEADRDLRQVLRQLRRADHEHPVARAVDRASASRRRTRDRRSARAGCSVASPVARSSLRATRWPASISRSSARMPDSRGQRLEHELDRAAARQAEPARLVGRDAVGHGFAARARSCPSRRTRSMMSSSMQPPETEPTTRPSSRTASIAPSRTRRAAPGLDDGDEQHAAARVEPLRAALQDFEIDAVHAIPSVQ